jgi:hypothetical protein
MNETLFTIIVFVVIGLFVILFKDAFMATMDVLDGARCTIGMDSYCK